MSGSRFLIQATRSQFLRSYFPGFRSQISDGLIGLFGLIGPLELIALFAFIELIQLIGFTELILFIELVGD